MASAMDAWIAIPTNSESHARIVKSTSPKNLARNGVIDVTRNVTNGVNITKNMNLAINVNLLCPDLGNLAKTVSPLSTKSLAKIVSDPIHKNLAKIVSHPDYLSLPKFLVASAIRVIEHQLTSYSYKSFGYSCV